MYKMSFSWNEIVMDNLALTTVKNCQKFLLFLNLVNNLMLEDTDLNCEESGVPRRSMHTLQLSCVNLQNGQQSQTCFNV